MNVELRINRADFSDLMRSYVDRRLRFALGRFGSRVGHVTVRLSGKGAGSPESSCRISTQLLPFGQVAVEESDSDLFVAIDRATGRVGRLFGRELERTREARTRRDTIRAA